MNPFGFACTLGFLPCLCRSPQSYMSTAKCQNIASSKKYLVRWIWMWRLFATEWLFLQTGSKLIFLADVHRIFINLIRILHTLWGEKNRCPQNSVKNVSCKSSLLQLLFLNGVIIKYLITKMFNEFLNVLCFIYVLFFLF